MWNLVKPHQTWRNIYITWEVKNVTQFYSILSGIHLANSLVSFIITHLLLSGVSLGLQQGCLSDLPSCLPNIWFLPRSIIPHVVQSCSSISEWSVQVHFVNIQLAWRHLRIKVNNVSLTEDTWRLYP